MELKNLGGGTGYLKAGLFGFGGSGKTFTAAKLATGTRAFQKLQGPVAMLDTEAAAQYIAPLVKAETGLDLIGKQTRVLRDAIEFLRACKDQGVSVAIIDSVTHLWREVCDSYLKQVNEKLREKGKHERSRMEFQDWAPIKAEWGKFADLYLNIPMHVIICGRAGYEYDFEQREDGSGKDLVKTGIRMKTEGEFGYEPSLLIHMEQVQIDGDRKFLSNIIHRATITKDRFGVLDGQSHDNPDFAFFRPFVERLTPGTLAVAPTDGQTDMKVDDAGDADWSRERKRRAIFCEEIQGALLVSFPGQSADEKKAKAALLHDLFGTYSWEAVQGMDADKLKLGLDNIPEAIKNYKAGLAQPIKPPPGKTEAEKAADHFAAPLPASPVESKTKKARSA